MKPLIRPYFGKGVEMALRGYPSISHDIRLGSTRPLLSGQISIIPKPELRGFWGDSPTKPSFKVTSAEVVILCPIVVLW